MSGQEVLCNVVARKLVMLSDVVAGFHRRMRIFLVGRGLEDILYLCLLTPLPLFEIPPCVRFILLPLHLLDPLPLVLLPDCFVENAPFVCQCIDSLADVQELEVAAGLRALIRLSAFLFFSIFTEAAIEAPIIEHVQADEVCHLVVHDFALAELERQVLVVFVSRSFLVAANELKIEVGRIFQHI